MSPCLFSCFLVSVLTYVLSTPETAKLVGPAPGQILFQDYLLYRSGIAFVEQNDTLTVATSSHPLVSHAFVVLPFFFALLLSCCIVLCCGVVWCGVVLPSLSLSHLVNIFRMFCLVLWFSSLVLWFSCLVLWLSRPVVSCCLSSILSLSCILMAFFRFLCCTAQSWSFHWCYWN